MSKQIINITLRQVVNSIGPFRELISVPMPAPTAFNIRKIASLVEGERQSIEETLEKRKIELIGEDGEPKEGAEAIFNKEVNELLDGGSMEVEGAKVKIQDLGTANVTPSTLMALDWLIVG